MAIRTTENEHAFQDRLFERLGAHSLQGLLIDKDGNFSAAIEAVEFEDNDDLIIPFKNEKINARFVLASKIKVPFYIVCYKNDVYRIALITKSSDGELHAFVCKKLEEADFAAWWGELKGMPQVKPLANGGGPRADQTVFDSVLQKYGLEWGGNIDGFVLTEDGEDIECIIDNISVSTGTLDNERANPAQYFHSSNPKHGPRYQGWLGAVKLSNMLQVPHVLFTIDKNHPEEEHVGFTFISALSPDGIEFVNNTAPNENVVIGLDNIEAEYKNKIHKIDPPDFA